MSHTLKLSTPGLVEEYQKKVLRGITEINAKMQTLPLEDRMAYLLRAQTSLSSQIDELAILTLVRAMKVIEQDLSRTITMVLDLQERHRLGSASNNSRLPTTIPRGDRGRRASLAPITTEDQQHRIVSPPGEKVGEKEKKAAIKGILRPPREEFFEDILQGTSNMETVKKRSGLN
ncbi:hypothetical protein MFRU_049g00100 [Monilinia fructicola]|nr:hypothetical protein MFRU_049g00100 [Monilinia fructicola]